MQDYLCQQKDITAAYVFGSYAQGKQRPESDLDIGIVFSQRPDTYNRLFEIGMELEKITDGPKVDVRELNLEDSPVFLMSALKEAKLICENNPQQRINFEVKVMQEFNDTQKGREIQYYYMTKRIKEGKYAN